MLLVCKMVHGSLSRAVHGICIVLSWASPVEAKLSILVLLYFSICKRYAIYRVAPGGRTMFSHRYPKSVYSRHMRKR